MKPASGEVAPFAEPVYVTRPLLPDFDAFVRTLREVWDSRWLTNGGAQHRALEEALRAALAVPQISLFNNGTTALLAACRALGLAGEVVTTPFTFPATPHALVWSGLTPVFCDVDPETMNLDPARAAAAVTPRTSAILAVHVYGTPCDVAGIQRVADRHGLRVLYDAAHAFGVTVDGTGVGNFGDLAMFSFHATKLFHTAEGGALTCRDAELRERLELLKNFGIAGEEEVLVPGINGKMSELQAALGLHMLAALEEERGRRRELAATYRRELAGVPGLDLPPPAPGAASSLQYFVVRVREALFGCSRDALHQRLRAYNVFTRKYFHPLCSDYPCYRQLPSAAPSNLPVAHAAAREVLCLPFHGGVGREQAEAICRLIRG